MQSEETFHGSLGPHENLRRIWKEAKAQAEEAKAGVLKNIEQSCQQRPPTIYGLSNA